MTVRSIRRSSPSTIIENSSSSRLAASAVLRAKTLLGEAYIELAPGNTADGMLEDGDTLPRAQVAKSVQLDEIFRSFDAVCCHHKCCGLSDKPCLVCPSLPT